MEKTRKLGMSLTTKAVVLSLIVLTFLMMLIPVYQIGKNHEYRIRIANAKETIVQLEDMQRTLKSEISYSRSPEALIENVVEYSLQYDEIDPSAAILVAKAEV